MRLSGQFPAKGSIRALLVATGALALGVQDHSTRAAQSTQEPPQFRTNTTLVPVFELFCVAIPQIRIRFVPLVVIEIVSVLFRLFCPALFANVTVGAASTIGADQRSRATRIRRWRRIISNSS